MRKFFQKMTSNVIKLGVLILVFVFLVYINNIRFQNSNIEMPILLENKSHDDLIELSKLLTKTVQILGKISCNITSNQVSVNGGWCATISSKNSTLHLFDDALAQELSIFLAGAYFCFIRHTN